MRHAAFKRACPRASKTEFFENGAAAFQPQERPHRQVEEKQKRIEFLEKKIQTNDEVLVELMAEHVALKNAWVTLTGVWFRTIRGTGSWILSGAGRR
jgi:hypothetical protein